MISSKLIYQSLLGFVALSMRSSIAIATTAPTPAPTEIQPDWVPFYNTGTFASEDDVASNTELVEIWNRSPNQLIHRKCPACMPSHQDIFYRRFDTNGLPQYMDLLSTMTETWSSFGNQEILGQTFKLYSTYNDAINDTNAWTYCNYDLEDVGFPRECGVTVHTGGQYNSMNLPSWPDIAFYVEALPVTSSPTEAPTASPTPAVSVFMNHSRYDSGFLTFHRLICSPSISILWNLTTSIFSLPLAYKFSNRSSNSPGSCRLHLSTDIRTFMAV